MLSRARLERIIKEAGATRVSVKATEALAEFLEDKLTQLIREANGFARHAGRKTLFASDVKLARKKLNI